VSDAIEVTQADIDASRKLSKCLIVIAMAQGIPAWFEDEFAAKQFAAHRISGCKAQIEKDAEIALGFSLMRDRPKHADAPKLIAQSIRSQEV